MDEFDQIIDSDLPEVEKLARAYAWITGRVVAEAGREIELARAMNDTETLVKAQIKQSVMNHAREIFDFCRQRVRVGKEARE